MIALDTNLLVYAAAAQAPQHAAAVAALDRARMHPSGWGISFPVIPEFWSVTTGRASGARPATPAEAAHFIADIGAAGAQIWFPCAGADTLLAALARNLGIRGVYIFDLQIALIAREHGAREIWTHDAGFVTVPGLRVRDPLAD